MVWASETFGPPPVWSACWITTSVSACHHSPTTQNESDFAIAQDRSVLATSSSRSTSNKNAIVFPRRSGVHVGRRRRRTLTEDDGDLLVGRRERVGHAELGEDDDGPVDGGAQPGDVRVPPQRAALPDHGEVVHVALPRLDRALRDVRRPVRPPRPQLPDAVPGRPHRSHVHTISISPSKIC
jgi:hypothetical protein